VPSDVIIDVIGMWSVFFFRKFCLFIKDFVTIREGRLISDVVFVQLLLLRLNIIRYTSITYKKLRYREEHSASVVLSWCTL